MSQTSFNNFTDYENGLIALKASMQDRSEEERLGDFNGAANVIAISGHPRNVRFALDCGVAADFVLYGSYIKARSVEFWIYLASVSGAITIIDPVVGNDVNQTDGTLSYVDFDNAYVDGVDTDSITTGWSHIVLTSSTDVTWASGFNIGKGDIRVTGLRYWQNELSSTEVGQLMNGTVGDYQHDSVLVLDFPNLTDLSGNGNDGTLPGGAANPTVVASGRNNGNCFSFDGVDDYVTMGDTNDMGTGDFTINLKAYIKSIPASGVNWIINKGENSNIEIFYAIAVHNNGNFLIAFYDGTGTSWVYDNSISASLNKWYDIAVVVDRSTDVRIYFDGVLSATDTGANSVDMDSAEPLVIGAYSNNVTVGNFDGLIDEVRIYTRSLTPMEVHANYLRQQRGLL